jgi:hypothetical protein
MILNKTRPRPISLLLVLWTIFIVGTLGQSPKTALIERGSQTAKGGFKNEDEIRDKFNNWKNDREAQGWLASMGYKPTETEYVVASKPHGEKSDIEVRVKTGGVENREGVSIKLVSSATGFNQIDKRWLAMYAKIWKMPADVQTALRHFVGETPPSKPGRDPKRMFLTELSADSQKAIVDFFTTNKTQIVSDLFEGDGLHAAGWLMVAFKATPNTRWTLRRSTDVVKFFAEGPVVVTKQGNLRIGRITMQRKGGDGGRESAKMLQFKINPALLL